MEGNSAIVIQLLSTKCILSDLASFCLGEKKATNNQHRTSFFLIIPSWTLVYHSGRHKEYKQENQKWSHQAGEATQRKVKWGYWEGAWLYGMGGQHPVRMMGVGTLSCGDHGGWHNTGMVEAEAWLYGLSYVTVVLDMACYGGWDLDLLLTSVATLLLNQIYLECKARLFILEGILPME